MGSMTNRSGAVKWPLAWISKPFSRGSARTLRVESSPSSLMSLWSGVSMAAGWPSRTISLPRTVALLVDFGGRAERGQREQTQTEPHGSNCTARGFNVS